MKENLLNRLPEGEVFIEKPRVVDFLGEFSEALKNQLLEDEKLWGDTWLIRPITGQEERTFKDYSDWFDQFKNGNQPVPWLKVAGDALICWIREKNPEMFKK